MFIRRRRRLLSCVPRIRAWGARDGNKRGAEVAIGAVIRALGYPIEESVKRFFQPKLLNWAGDEVGDITTPEFVLGS